MKVVRELLKYFKAKFYLSRMNSNRNLGLACFNLINYHAVLVSLPLTQEYHFLPICSINSVEYL